MINYIDRSQTESSSNNYLFTLHAAGRLVARLNFEIQESALSSKTSPHIVLHAFIPYRQCIRIELDCPALEISIIPLDN